MKILFHTLYPKTKCLALLLLNELISIAYAPDSSLLSLWIHTVNSPLFSLQKNHIFSSGASGTNAAVIRGALRAEKPELLTVILPQSLKKQPPESQELLSKVRSGDMINAKFAGINKILLMFLSNIVILPLHDIFYNYEITVVIPFELLEFCYCV